MLPNYRPGELVLAWRLPVRKKDWLMPKEGQVVVVKSPQRRLLKRVDKVEQGQVWLVGDNRRASTDSRTFGPINVGTIEAKVFAKLG